MNRSTLLIAALTLAASAAMAQTNLGEDFTGSWGSFSSLDTTLASNEVVRTPTVNASNQSLGTWGGYWPPAATGGGAGLYFNNSTSFGADPGSRFRSLAGVGAGFLTFPAYTGAEAGAYAYTAPFGPISLAASGESARVQFDATVTDIPQATSAIQMRLLLRVPNNPSPPAFAWIISSPFNLAGANATPSFLSNPANWRTPNLASPELAAISIRPDTLTWQAFSATDARLLPGGVMTSGDEAVGAPTGGTIPSFVVNNFILPSVSGFGLYLETNLTDNPSPTPGQGVWIDAIHLMDRTYVATLPVELSLFTADN